MFDFDKIRKIPHVVGDVALILLNDGMIAVIDSDNAEFVKGRLWTAVRAGKTWFAQCGRRGADSRYLHRLVMFEPKSQSVIPKNGCGLDCRRANLRLGPLGPLQAHRARASDQASDAIATSDQAADVGPRKLELRGVVLPDDDDPFEEPESLLNRVGIHLDRITGDWVVVLNGKVDAIGKDRAKLCATYGYDPSWSGEHEY